jgi:hypothetical protein
MRSSLWELALDVSIDYSTPVTQREVDGHEY